MSRLPNSLRQTSSDAGVPVFAASRRRNLASLEVFLWIVIAVAVVFGIGMKAGLNFDFPTFYAGGSKALHGNLSLLYHTEIPVPGNGAEGFVSYAPFVAAPISAYLYTFMAWLPPRPAMILFRIEITLALTVVLFLAYRHFRPGAAADNQWFRVAILGMIVLYQPMWSIYLVGGQNTPTVMLFLTLAYFANLRGWDWWCALLWVLAVCTKPVLVVGLCLFAILSGKRLILRMAIAGLAVAGFSILLLGWGIHQEFLYQLSGSATRLFPWIYNSSLFVTIIQLQNAAVEAHRSTAVLQGVMQVLRLGELVGLVWLIREFRHLGWAGETRKRIVFMLAIAFALAFAPTVWEHYLTFMVFFTVNVLAIYPRLSRPSRILLFATLAALVFQNLEFNLRLSWRYPTLSTAGLVLSGLYKSAALFLLLSLFVAVRRELVPSHESN